MREKLYHLINGIRSGIPFCCVWFFVNRQDVEGLALKLHYARGGTRGNWIKDTCNYVRCDKCFDKKYEVPVKRNGVICEWLMED